VHVAMTVAVTVIVAEALPALTAEVEHKKAPKSRKSVRFSNMGIPPRVQCTAQSREGGSPVQDNYGSMKILVVGANGTIGKAVVEELKTRHEIVSAGRTSGDQRIDIGDLASIRALFVKVGQVDAVVSAAGDVHFGPLLEMTPEQLQIGLSHKLMGQVHLALEAAKHLNPGGSVTLVAGSLSHDPIRFGASASLVNSAIEGFVRAAAIEFPPGMRINAVSPTVLCESMGAYGAYFRGTECVPAKRVGLAFSKSVEGAQTGQVYFVE